MKRSCTLNEDKTMATFSDGSTVYSFCEKLTKRRALQLLKAMTQSKKPLPEGER